MEPGAKCDNRMSHAHTSGKHDSILCNYLQVEKNKQEKEEGEKKKKIKKKKKKKKKNEKS